MDVNIRIQISNCKMDHSLPTCMNIVAFAASVFVELLDDTETLVLF